MKKTLKKSIIVALFAILLLSTILGGTYAATPVTISGTDTPHSLTITRNVKDVTNNVTNVFGYTITADSGNPLGATNEPTTATVTFNNVAPDSITHKATQTSVVDFTGATYTKVGDYKYILQETSSTDTTTYPVMPTEYEMYVSVRYAVNDQGQQTGALVATLIGQVTVKGDKTKTDIVYPNESVFTNITISKNVTGNMADQEEYFKFKLVVNGNTGDKYVIAGQDATVTYNNASVITNAEYTVGGGDQYVYLKHGQTITIGKLGSLNQIKVGAKYQLIEQDADTYKTYINSSSTDSKDSGELTTVEIKNVTDNKISVVNNKEETTLTGVFIDMAPYIAIIVVAVLGMFFFVKTNNKKEDK